MKPELKIRTNDYSPAINNQLIYVPVRHSTPVENIRQITPIVQNKPKVKSPQIHSSDVITSTYDQMDNWLNQTNKPNQTQFKANSNPIAKMAVNPCHKKAYAITAAPGPQKTNPKQTQSQKAQKMNANICNSKTYIKNTAVRPIKTKPNKADNQSSTSAIGIIDNHPGGKPNLPAPTPFRQLRRTIPAPAESRSKTSSWLLLFKSDSAMIARLSISFFQS